MNRDEILAKSRKENKNSDERELIIKIKAFDLAGKITLLVLSLVALSIVIDGDILESGRLYSYNTVGGLLISIGLLYCLISEAYLLAKMKERRKVFSVVFFACFLVYVIVKIICGVL